MSLGLHTFNPPVAVDMPNSDFLMVAPGESTSDFNQLNVQHMTMVAVIRITR